MYKINLLAACVLLGTNSPSFADDDGHEGANGNLVELTAAQRAAAGIEIDTVGEHGLSETVTLPGEVVVNAYRSASVTTRIMAQIVSRHVRLGDVVELGQRLVTLSSVEMAEAQGALIITDRDWQRVSKLGKSAVSERRFTEAQILNRQALAAVLAYGMSAEQADKLLKSNDAALGTGEFDLFAPQRGTILDDDFILGELIEPGRVLFSISDETTLWIEASTVPGDLASFDVGAPARISHGAGHWIDGQVIQLHHRLDETTRRQGLRIEVDNSDDHLHPGQFVEVEISTGQGTPVLAVPSEAITLIRGAPTVFKLESDHELHIQEVTTGAAAGGWTEIRSGLVAGDEIAVSGVFTLKSLLLKSSIGDEH